MEDGTEIHSGLVTLDRAIPPDALDRPGTHGQVIGVAPTAGPVEIVGRAFTGHMAPVASRVTGAATGGDGDEVLAIGGSEVGDTDEVDRCHEGEARFRPRVRSGEAGPATLHPNRSQGST